MRPAVSPNAGGIGGAEARSFFVADAFLRHGIELQRAAKTGRQVAQVAKRCRQMTGQRVCAGPALRRIVSTKLST